MKLDPVFKNEKKTLMAKVWLKQKVQVLKDSQTLNFNLALPALWRKSWKRQPLKNPDEVPFKVDSSFGFLNENDLDFG